MTKHYQYMLKTDYLPRIVDKTIVHDVFARGRRVFGPGSADPQGSMPEEFTGTAFRLGHSMIRMVYEWNSIFNSTGGPGVFEPGHLDCSVSAAPAAPWFRAVIRQDHPTT